MFMLVLGQTWRRSTWYARERKKAIGIFELMKYYKFKVGVDTINCLLDTHGRAKLVKEMQLLFEKLKERFTPNLQTFTALLNGWCSSKNLMEVGRVWNEMVDKGFKHDIVAHNTMLRGLLRGHKRSDAIKLFKVMKAKGPSPNTRNYHIGRAVWDEMIQKGFCLDDNSYTILIGGLINQGRSGEACKYLEGMVEK
ncbi:hypothetical protein DVH24_034069 [Malus domestica]|uniref:Pentacotripeptide-repeat region of PRORP domain-containing protein n=1 Tax=Malus domestica TaxID=3750 RepID=A0A498KUL6_MALDO|nr:hypothetical protein DVH24_034069 [Malus domestica]